VLYDNGNRIEDRVPGATGAPAFPRKGTSPMSRRTTVTTAAITLALGTALGTVPAATAAELPGSSVSAAAPTDTGSNDLLAGLPDVVQDAFQVAVLSVAGSAIVGSYALCWAGEDPENPTGHCTF
jgi:hypothetical protein